jgi:hypothetical protein
VVVDLLLGLVDRMEAHCAQTLTSLLLVGLLCREGHCVQGMRQTFAGIVRVVLRREVHRTDGPQLNRKNCGTIQVACTDDGVDVGHDRLEVR